MDSTTNLLGALSLAVSDRIESYMKEALNRSGESAATIIFLGYTPGLTVEILRQVLSLSHPGTVRLVDRLCEDGLVERRKAKDRRAVSLHLTRKGSAARKKLMTSRNELLESSLKGLNNSERIMLGKLIAKVLVELPETEMDKHHICRHCSVALCSNDCPIPGHATILEPYRKDKNAGT